MATRTRTAVPIDFSDFGAEAWFEDQPRQVLMAMTIRMALRLLPLTAARPISYRFHSEPILALFRLAFSLWGIAKYRHSRGRLRTAVTGATNAAHKYYADAIAVAYFASDLATSKADNPVLSASLSIRSAINDTRKVAHLSAVATAGAATHDATAIDAAATQSGRIALAIDLAGEPLWSDTVPAAVAAAWSDIKTLILNTNEDWEVWIDWYEDRLIGRPSLGEEFDVSVATLPSALWEQGPKAVNAKIKELIAHHTPAEPIPAQGAGPHFALSPAHRIGLATPSEIDAAGNNLGRLRQQLPLVREAADDIAGRLNPNAFPELARNLAAYRAAIEGEPETIAWGVVFGRGVRLDNAAAAARRLIEDRLQPPLEDPAQEALDSVLTLHGPMILATAEGCELMDDADRMLLTREQQAALRTDALAVSTALNDDKDVIEPPAAELVMEAVETIGEGPHPERGSAVGGAAIRNVTIWAVGIAAIAAIAGVGFLQAGAAVIAVEGLKKSKRFSTLTDALGARIDGVLRTGAAFQNFVIRNEQPLRQMASNSVGMRWMLPCIDDVVRRNAGKPPPDQP